MGLFLRQTEQRSEVQKRVATEMQERMRKTTLKDQQELEPAFLENQHTTRKAGVIIIALVVLLCIAVTVYAIRIS